MRPCRRWRRQHSDGFVLRVFGGERSELLLFGRRLILAHWDISFGCHAILIVPRFALAGHAIAI